LLVDFRLSPVNQLLNALQEQLNALSASVPTWIEDGVECQFLKAQEGGGWKKGKIRLRVEIVPDVPEPSPDAIFLNSLRTDINPQQ